MPSFAVLGHRLRPSPQERAFADTLTLPVLLPPIERDGLVVVLQPLRPPRVTPLPRVRNLRPLLVSVLGLTLTALPAADLRGDELPGRFAGIAAAPVPAAVSADGPAAAAMPVAADSPLVTVPPPSAPPAVVPKPPAGAVARRPLPAKSAGWLEHEWRVAEAMRQRYRELYSHRLVDRDAWQAREAEALRARQRWEATAARREPT